MKGSPAVQVYWRKKETLAPGVPATPDAASLASTENLNFMFNDDMSEDQIRKQTDTLVRVVMASGKIKNEELFRSEMTKTVSEIHQKFGGLNTGSAGAWAPAVFRFDLSVEISGKVAWVATLGGGLRVRLEWHKTARPHLAPARNVTEVAAKERADIEKLLALISTALPSLPTSEQTDFDLKSIRIGLGLSAKGDIGVVKGSVSAMTQVVFKKAAARMRPSDHRLTAVDGKILFIEQNPSEKHVEFAQNRHVLHSFQPKAGQGDKSEATYEIDLKDFEEGFRNAAEMAVDFMKVENRGEESAGAWKLHTVKMQYDMSLTGKAGMVTVGGLVSSELQFENVRF